MIGLGLVRPLEADWREALDATARRRGWPTSQDVAKLGANVAELSAAYNDPARARAGMREAGAARLGWAFPRDVPKGAAAVRELVALGCVRLDCEREPLRILDLGAGLGATTWGVLRALTAAGGRGFVDATWVDSDRAALELGVELARARHSEPMSLRVQAHGEGLAWSDRVRETMRFDLVLVGQLLSELDLELPDPERVQKHAAMLARWIEHHLEEHGSLVVIEPALRDRTRHLHRVRDSLLRLSDRTDGVGHLSHVTVFAPCLHAAPCPALARETDWCHEDLPVDVPSWLVPVAQAAGLRREGLTFSYLVVRRDGARLVDALPTGQRRARLRVVSGAMPSKGKHEAFVCGELESGGALVPARARVMRLDRDARAPNAPWADAARGELLVVSPPPKLERPRIDSATIIEPVESARDETR
jgi:hypothetical protein